MRKRTIFALVLLVALLLAEASFAAPMTSNPQTMPKAYSTGAHGANEVPPGKSPLTGMDFQGEYRPIVVQISNSEAARPHLNMADADIVYEAVYWGPAHTRYTAVYNDVHPELVGSVRSARVYHLELRDEWDAPFVFWGGQDTPGTSIYEYIRNNNLPSSFLFDGTKSVPQGTLSRINTRVSPHNAVANLALIVQNHWPINEETGQPHVPRQHAYRFSSMPTRGSDTAKEINIKYDEKGEYNPSYTFNEATRQYERWYNGAEQMDGESGRRITASNVIVQYADLRFHNQIASRPVINTLGTGVIDAFIDGQHIRGTWERKSLRDRTVFLDMGGNEITMLPGKTFIQIIPSFATYTYTTNAGEVKTADIGMPVTRTTIELDDGEIDVVEGM